MFDWRSGIHIRQRYLPLANVFLVCQRESGGYSPFPTSGEHIMEEGKARVNPVGETFHAFSMMCCHVGSILVAGLVLAEIFIWCLCLLWYGRTMIIYNFIAGFIVIDYFVTNVKIDFKKR